MGVALAIASAWAAPGGTAAAPAPTVSSVAPSAGVLSTQTPVTINGANFVSGAGAAVDGVPCTSVVFVGATQLTAVAPAGLAIGGKTVRVTNPDTQYGELANGFTYTDPVGTGLLAWYMAGYGVSLTSGKVSGYSDQSGTGDANKNAVQGTAANRPTFVAADPAFNGQPIFNGDTTDFLGTPAWAAPVAQPFSVFFVARGPGAGASYYIYDGLAASEANAASVSGFAAIQAGGLLFNTPDFGATPFVGGAEYNGGSSKIYNSALTAIATGAAGAGGMTGLTIMAAFDGLQTWSRDHAELLVYQGILSAPNRALVMNYLGNKYGITIGA